jgi:hypothetical protein
MAGLHFNNNEYFGYAKMVTISETELTFTQRQYLDLRLLHPPPPTQHPNTTHTHLILHSHSTTVFLVCVRSQTTDARGVIVETR